MVSGAAAPLSLCSCEYKSSCGQGDEKPPQYQHSLLWWSWRGSDGRGEVSLGRGLGSPVLPEIWQPFLLPQRSPIALLDTCCYSTPTFWGVSNDRGPWWDQRLRADGSPWVSVKYRAGICGIQSLLEALESSNCDIWSCHKLIKTRLSAFIKYLKGTFSLLGTLL